MRVIIRGFKNGTLDFEESFDNVPERGDPRGQWVLEVAERHAKRLMDVLHMIEIEFPDEPDERKRYFRFGTDPTLMVQPLRFDLKEI